MKTILLSFILTIIFCNSYSQSDLNGVTFGFGAGYSIMQDRIYDYSLTTDTSHFLQRQFLSKGSFVISSVVSVKLGKLQVNAAKQLLNAKTGTMSGFKDFTSRFSINAALNLVEINSDNVSFNKNIDGGLGIGFFLTENVQISAFYDIQRIRQLREYIVDKYLGERVPNGVDYYNALDTGDNALFYNKTFTGYSFKVIFSLGNK